MNQKLRLMICAALLVSGASYSQEYTLETILTAVINANQAGDSAAVSRLAEIARERAILLESRVPLVSSNTGVDRYHAQVTERFSRCDYFIAEGPSGYFVFEWYGGHDPSVGEIIMGDINSYGMKSVLYPRRDRDGRVWVESYLLSYTSAMAEINDHCDLR